MSNDMHGSAAESPLTPGTASVHEPRHEAVHEPVHEPLHTTEPIAVIGMGS